MSRHDPRRPRFLLQGPIEELREGRPAPRRDDETRELVDELEQILSGRQAALPSPRDFGGDDEPPFAPRDVVADTYDPYEIDEGDDDERYDDGLVDDDYYDQQDAVRHDNIEAVDYWVPAPYGAPAEQRRLPPPPPEAPFRVSPARRVAYFAGIGAIFVVAAAGAYFAFQLASNPVEPGAETALAEPAADEPVMAAEAARVIEAEPVAAEPPPIIVNVERIDPRVPAEPGPPEAAPPADEAAAPVAESPPAGPAAAAAPAAPGAIEPAAAPAPAEVAAAVETPAPTPLVTAGPVTEFGITTAWVNLRTGPSNANPVIGVVAAGTEVGVVACERWCEVEANGNRGWIHGDFIRTDAGQEAVAALPAEPNAAEPAAAPVAFTANTIGGAWVYDSPFEDGAVVETLRGEILIVGCDVNWCETRFGAGNRRGWVARTQLRIPEDITVDLMPPLPPITRDEAPR